MTPEEKARRGEKAERLLKDDVLTQAFADTVEKHRSDFFGQDFDADRAKAAHMATRTLEALRDTLRRYAGEARAINHT